MPASQLAPTSLGHVAVTRGSQVAVTARFEELASKAQLEMQLQLVCSKLGLQVPMALVTLFRWNR